MVMTKGTYGTKVSLKMTNQDGRCLATLLMPGGVAGFPALRFAHDFLSMQPILQSVVSFHYTPLHFHIKSLWFEMISIIKVSARLSLHPRQGCHFPYVSPKICCTKIFPGSRGLGFEDKHKAEGCPWTHPRISGGHPERKRNPCWCLCAENSYQIKLWLMVGPMDNEHLFCKLSWLFLQCNRFVISYSSSSLLTPRQRCFLGLFV